MNPDTGRIHELTKDASGQEVIGEAGKKKSAIEAMIESAADKVEEIKPSTEPTPGTPVPDDWPRFEIGDEVGPIKGWWFKINKVDVENQTLTIKPSRKTKGDTNRGKRRRKNRSRRRGR